MINLQHYKKFWGKYTNSFKYIYIYIHIYTHTHMGFLGGSDGKESTCNVGDLGLIPGLGRCPGEGNGNPLQYSCLENSRTEESGGLQSMGSQRVRHDWLTDLLNIFL